MPLRMSFSKTLRQFRDRSKTVTRRDGWWDLELDEPRVPVGGIITGIEKGMGLAKGERQVVLGDVRVLAARREPLGDITPEDVAREGFPGKSTEWFIHELYRKPPEHIVTRIGFEHVVYWCRGCKSVTTPELPGPAADGCAHCGCGSESIEEAA